MIYGYLAHVIKFHVLITRFYDTMRIETQKQIIKLSYILQPGYLSR